MFDVLQESYLRKISFTSHNCNVQNNRNQIAFKILKEEKLFTRYLNEVLSNELIENKIVMFADFL